MALRDWPLFTDVYTAIDLFQPESNSAYLFRRSVEERSLHFSHWIDQRPDVLLIDIEQEEKATVAIDISGTKRIVGLRSDTQLSQLWKDVERTTVYLDITGLRHHVWAALLRAAILARLRIVVIYVEPDDYRPSITPTEGEIYDLSERIEGISPLPGFARLSDPGERACFVPLLGFEGARLAYLLEQVEPPGNKIVPIIGVPGFRPEYPFFAYLGNRRPLSATKAWQNVRFVTANCPFSLFYRLQEIEECYADHVLKIAPIGTKPHAIGAVLYAAVRPAVVELVYDHPIRKARRTEGTARLLAYHVWCLIG